MLGMGMQSFEIQRVLDGEKAQRSETARQLQETERRLAAAASPQKAAMQSKRDGLQEQLSQQSAQVKFQTPAPDSISQSTLRTSFAECCKASIMLDKFLRRQMERAGVPLRSANQGQCTMAFCCRSSRRSSI